MQQVLYKKKYSIREFYIALYKGIRTVPFLRKSRKNNLISEAFVKRIMLAVTEVNGCEVCSYEHTKTALEMGMAQSEIEQLLTGVMDGIPADEMKAILFAQHYADTKGNPTKASWEEIVDVYGEKRALGILGAIRMIMIGNSYGIALSAFKSRRKGEAIEKSSLLYELTMMASIVPLLPLAIGHAVVCSLLRRPIISIKEGNYATGTSE